LFYDLYGFRRSFSGTNGLNVFRFYAKKIKIFVFSGSWLIFKPKKQLAEYDIVGMFAENLVEVGYVWWVNSGKILFFSNSSKKSST
jgi:hypothetical protein